MRTVILKHLVHLFLSCMLLLPAAVHAWQGSPAFTAATDARQVTLGGYFEISFTLNEAQGTDFKPPAFTDFSILSGPSQSTSVSAINGVWSRSMAISYTLQPRKIGKFTIPPATILVNGKQLRSNAVTVEVVQGKASNANTQDELITQVSEQIFIKAIPNKESAFIGEQIVLDYKLYTTREIATYNLISESEYSGFFAQDIRRFNARIVREVINGVQYSTKILKRVALFPQQAGNLQIDPMEMQLAVVIDSEPRRRNFFYAPAVNRIQVSTEPLDILIDHLPKNAPPSFTGAVGKFQMSSVINRSSLSTDDAITLTMTFNGNGDIKRVQPPKLEVPASFEVYEPRIVEERSFEDANGIITGKKTVEYILLPKEPGRYELPPRFTYFDTDSLAYITLQPQTYNLQVQKGTRPPEVTGASAKSASATKSLRDIKTSTGLKQKESSFFGSTAYWILSLLPIFLMTGAIAYKRIRANDAGIDLVQLRRQQAQQLAQKRLRLAGEYLQSKDSNAFYDEISRALFGYICDKLNMPLSELSKQNVEARLRSLQVSDRHIESFMKLIQTCEMARFAGMDNSAAMQGTYDQALELVTNIEAEL